VNNLKTSTVRGLWKILRTMSSKCVVNFACPGRERYLLGQERLKRSLQTQKYKGHLIFYTNSYPPKCPPHHQVPYAFKWYGLQDAFNRGCDLVLWLDASVVVLKPMTSLWEVVEKRGILLFDNPGVPAHFFTSKDCLDKLKCSLEEAQKINQVVGGVVGFNRNHPDARNVVDWMLNLSRDGVSFQGGSCTSPHPKFIVHRHDQSCLSIISHRMKIKREPFEWVRYSSSVIGKTILELRGM
jgi:hypothetical protein